MITLSSRHITDLDIVCASLEAMGFTVCVVDNEPDPERDFYSPHDWQSEAEYQALRKFLKS
jgi:hypothetical protein